MIKNYDYTIRGCFLAYICQAIIVNFPPLLFVTFQSEFSIGLEKISMIISINFAVQLLVDLICVRFIDKIGYRASMIIALSCCAIGLIGLVFLPNIYDNKFIGLLICVVIYAIGGGMLEVLVGPIVENCPTKNKEGIMSLLHSFYCWGHVLVVAVSTIYFYIVGIQYWRYLAILWAIIPIINIIMFTYLSMPTVKDEHISIINITNLIKNKMFWVMVLLMVCAGATEQSVSQWISTFAEQGLGIAKTFGDLAGAMSFALLMGISRLFYGKYSEKISLTKFMIICSFFCIITYIIAGLSQNSVISLVACSLTGLFVGIMWPGTTSLSAKSIKNTSTAMFAFLALGGDLGCSLGPTLVGMISKTNNDNLKLGVLSAVIFPTILFFSLLINKYIAKRRTKRQL